MAVLGAGGRGGALPLFTLAPTSPSANRKATSPALIVPAPRPMHVPQPGGSGIAPDSSSVGLGLALAMPIGYAVFGAISSMIAAALYNLVAGWVGGLEFEVQ